MAELTNSIFALSWATALFGVQQFANLLRPSGSTKVKAASYKLTSAIQAQFGANPFLFALEQIGDEASRATVDLFGDMLRLKPLDPSWLGSRTERVARCSLETAMALLPVENLQSTWQELRNTFVVINLVNRAASMLNLPSGEVRLREAVGRAYSLGSDYAALWLIEGLGEEYAQRNSPESRPARGLLIAGQAAELPEKCLLMMHAGMGIAFARQAVGSLTPYSSRDEISAALARFVDLVRSNARPGYEGPAFESLGLVTRTWYPQMVSLIDGGLWTLDPLVLEYFWHGLGRAIYFNPLTVLPGANAFRKLATEAPHRLALLNGTAGVAWAFSLVNLRQPEITLHLVKNQTGFLEANDAFTGGLVSTVLMARDMLPDAPFATAFANFRPPSKDAELQAAWDRLVRIPVHHGIERLFPILKRSRRLGEVFRYQDLEELAARLEG